MLQQPIFGRLEIRKGLKLFCDALDELCADPLVPDFEVTFLGKETQIYGRSSIGYISDRSKQWSVPWRIASNKFRGAAVEYLRQSGRLTLQIDKTAALGLWLASQRQLTIP